MAGDLLPEWFFFGPHRNGGWHKAQEGNRELVRRNCAAIEVSAEELASAVDEHGVDSSRSQALVRRLIERSRNTALARTLGVDLP